MSFKRQYKVDMTSDMNRFFFSFPVFLHKMFFCSWAQKEIQHKRQNKRPWCSSAEKEWKVRKVRYYRMFLMWFCGFKFPIQVLCPPHHYEFYSKIYLNEWVLKISCFPFRYHNLVKDVRQNKGSILRATVEYVKVLKEDHGRYRQLEEKLKFQEFQQRKLLRILQVLVHFWSNFW